LSNCKDNVLFDIMNENMSDATLSRTLYWVKTPTVDSVDVIEAQANALWPCDVKLNTTCFTFQQMCVFVCRQQFSVDKRFWR